MSRGPSRANSAFTSPAASQNLHAKPQTRQSLRTPPSRRVTELQKQSVVSITPKIVVDPSAGFEDKSSEEVIIVFCSL